MPRHKVNMVHLYKIFTCLGINKTCYVMFEKKKKKKNPFSLVYILPNNSLVYLNIVMVVWEVFEAK